MSVPTDPTTVNASRLTPTHRESLQRTRTRALESFAVASATAEHLSTLPGIDESLIALAELNERLAKETFDAIDYLCTELDPEQTEVGEPIE